MPAIDANARNFLMTSDYPLDKIIYMNSGQIVASGTSQPSVSIPHGLGFMPLIVGSWSYNSDFSTSNETGDVFYGNPNVAYLTISSDATNLYIFPYNNTGSSSTLYWRAYGLMPSNVNVDAASTASVADKFVLNSGYNYTKIYSSSVANIAGNTTFVLTHNLGYRPQCDVWWTNPSTGRNERLSVASNDSGATDRARIFMTPTAFTIMTGSSAPTSDYHYRIYLDD